MIDLSWFRKKKKKAFEYIINTIRETKKVWFTFYHINGSTTKFRTAREEDYFITIEQINDKKTNLICLINKHKLESFVFKSNLVYIDSEPFFETGRWSCPSLDILEGRIKKLKKGKWTITPVNFHFSDAGEVIEG